ncbi:MAG: hypothetical protein NTV93_20395 [Verrucomicrobia bacterium]|nr:hypothetical protein [Verrucomicrobiota bacterium]
MTSTLDHLPRYVTIHQLARRSGLNRSTLTMMLAHGQIKPGAMQSVDRGRESFLFPASLIGEVAKLAGAGQLPLPPEPQKPL